MTATEATPVPALKLLSPAEVKAWVEKQSKRLIQEWKTFSGEEMGNEEEYVFCDLAGIFCWCNIPADRRAEADLFVATEEANELDDDEPEEDSDLEEDDEDDSDILDDDFEEVEDEDDEEEDDDEFPLDERDDEDEPEEEEE